MVWEGVRRRRAVRPNVLGAKLNVKNSEDDKWREIEGGRHGEVRKKTNHNQPTVSPYHQYPG